MHRPGPVSDLIDALGGTTAAAKIAGVSSAAVSTWRKRGNIPSRLYFDITDAANKRGVAVPGNLFLPATLRRHEQARDDERRACAAQTGGNAVNPTYELDRMMAEAARKLDAREAALGPYLSDVAVRLECLRMANCDADATSEVINRAQAYADFVLGAEDESR